MNKDGWKVEVSGLTIRDWFAGQALAGMSGTCLAASGYISDTPRRATMAKTAYDIADAMLAERDRPEEE